MVLPIPVPVYVPVPMNMYSQCTPNPVGVPLPVRKRFRGQHGQRLRFPSVTRRRCVPQLPVPMLLPVNMDNADRIVETIKKIKEKFPADPFEAELVLMAEMVSETNGGDGGVDKEGEMRPEIAAGGGRRARILDPRELFVFNQKFQQFYFYFFCFS